MGGRGVSSFSGGNGNNGSNFTDDSGVGMAHGIASATNMVVGAYGSERLQQEIDYVGNAMKSITGQDRYVTISIDGDATGSKGTYAWMYPMLGKMGINTNLLKYDTEVVARSYEKDVKSGFHPEGTTYRDIMVHEAAHRLDGVISEKMWSKGNGLDRSAASTHIVREAINRLKANGDKRKSYDIQNSLSGYGASYYKNHTGDSYVETFAEAIADYNANGSRANALSIEIVNITRDYIGRYQ